MMKNLESNQSELDSAQKEKKNHVDITKEMTDKTLSSIYPQNNAQYVSNFHLQWFITQYITLQNEVCRSQTLVKKELKI